MSAATPEELRATARELVDSLSKVLDGYKVLYPLGYERTRTSSMSSLGGGTLENDGTPRSLSSLLLDKRLFRDRLAAASRDVGRANDLLRGASRTILQLFEMESPPDTGSVDDSDVLIPRAEMRGIIKAQTRRRAAVAAGRGAMPWTEQDEMP